MVVKSMQKSTKNSHVGDDLCARLHFNWNYDNNSSGLIKSPTINSRRNPFVEKVKLDSGMVEVISGTLSLFFRAVIRYWH